MKTAAQTLLNEITEAKGKGQPQDLKDLAEDMEWSATTLAWSAKYQTPAGKTPEVVESENRFTWGLTPHYNAACFWADRAVPDVAPAMRSLVLAGETSDSEWLGKDPSSGRYA